MKATILMMAATAVILGGVIPAAGQSPACGGPESGQFDFWIGNWEVYAGGKLVGRNTITVILDGCTLLEEYNALESPYKGKSFNYFDPSDGMWHQVWVDNGGLRLHLKGRYNGQAMSMSGERMADGVMVIDRITWTENPDGTVRQLWQQTKDDGATWQVLFDGLYKPVDS